MHDLRIKEQRYDPAFALFINPSAAKRAVHQYMEDAGSDGPDIWSLTTRPHYKHGEITGYIAQIHIHKSRTTYILRNGDIE